MSAMTPRNPAGAPLLKPASFKARFWDRMASGYAGGTIGDWAGYERSLARTRELLGPGASVLEIGCGTGATALTLSLFTGPYLATDIAPQMIALANQRLARAPGPSCGFRWTIPTPRPARRPGRSMRCWPSTCCTCWTTWTPPPRAAPAC